MKQNLFFNILTFDWPKGPVNLYYSRTNQGTGQELYFTLFPNEVEQIFPGIVRNSTNKIYTSFGYPAEDFTLLPTKLQTENPDLVKRYYNDTINYYFRKKLGLIVKKGFINETQVWLKDERAGTDIFDVYHKFSLRVQIATVSRFPEIILTYDNTSKVCKQLRVLKKISTLRVVFFPKTLTAEPHPPFQELSLFFFSLFSFLF